MAAIRTDMAHESLRMNADLEGVIQQETKRDGAIVHAVKIESEQASVRLQKPMGVYLTIEPDGKEASAEQMEAAIADAIAEMLSMVSAQAHVLIVGLGNRFVTPDSLGPRTLDKLLITRHIKRFLPELAPDGLRPVSAICPGVLGVTGLETIEVVKGIVGEVKPDVVLCIDSLISLDAARIGKTAQLNDSGILPGAGVGNRQRGLDQKTLGLPVLALGVPTVVSACTIAALAIRRMQTDGRDDTDALVEQALSGMDEEMRDMIVTPKDVDKLIEDASRVLANALNRALLDQYYEQMRALLLQ